MPVVKALRDEGRTRTIREQQVGSFEAGLESASSYLIRAFDRAMDGRRNDALHEGMATV